MVRQLVLFLSVVFAALPTADTHTLQYRDTIITSGVKSTAVVLLDGEQFAYYDSNISQMIPKGQFGKKVEADEQKFWNSETQRVAAQQEKLVAVMKDFSDTEGIHTLQVMYGCEHDDQNTTIGFARYGYDGEDFFSLDLKTGTWTAVKPEAKSFIKKWDLKGNQVKHLKSYLEADCIDWLQKVVPYGRKALERKVRPEASVFQNHLSSPEVVCLATGFFPKSVMITWRKDGRDVYEDVELRETLPNQDGSFQKRSILKVPAEDLQKYNYTCVIQHSSLEKDLVLEAPKGAGSDGNTRLTVMIVAVVLAVVLAVVAFVAVGYIIWKRRSGRSYALGREPQVPY